MAKSKLTPQLKKRALKLSKMGFSDSAICQSVGIAKSTLYSKRYIDLLDTIATVREEAKEEVYKDLLLRSKVDASGTVTMFLADKLKVFSLPTYKLKKPTTVEEALNNISKIIADYGEGLLDDKRAEKLVSFNQAYLKSRETHIIEKQLEEILIRFEDESK